MSLLSVDLFRHNRLKLNDPITVVGDIHGQHPRHLLRVRQTGAFRQGRKVLNLRSVLRPCEVVGGVQGCSRTSYTAREIAAPTCQVGGQPGETQYIFLGDYVDRGLVQLEPGASQRSRGCRNRYASSGGSFSVEANDCSALQSFFTHSPSREVVAVLYSLKIKYPKQAPVLAEWQCESHRHAACDKHASQPKGAAPKAEALTLPVQVRMLRGNHECRQMTSFFNFREEGALGCHILEILHGSMAWDTVCVRRLSCAYARA